MEIINEDLFLNVMKYIKEIYEKSKYEQNTDLFEISEMITSFDRKQIQSKQYLAENLFDCYQKYAIKREKNPYFLIGGGWYGLMAHIINLYFPFAKGIMSVDYNQTCEIGSNIFNNTFSCHTSNIFDYELQCDVFVSTSVEHFDREELIFYLQTKPKYTICALQSNNWEDIDSHINCSESLDEFINYLPLRQIYFKGVQDMGEYERYTVIGI